MQKSTEKMYNKSTLTVTVKHLFEKSKRGPDIMDATTLNIC